MLIVAKCFLGWSTYEQPANYVWPPRWIPRYFFGCSSLPFPHGTWQQKSLSHSARSIHFCWESRWLAFSPKCAVSKTWALSFSFWPTLFVLAVPNYSHNTAQEGIAKPISHRHPRQSVKNDRCVHFRRRFCTCRGDRPPVALEINGEWLNKYQCSGELAAWCCSFWFSYSKLEQVNTEVWLLFLFF